MSSWCTFSTRLLASINIDLPGVRVSVRVRIRVRVRVSVTVKVRLRCLLALTLTRLAPSHCCISPLQDVEHCEGEAGGHGNCLGCQLLHRHDFSVQLAPRALERSALESTP